MSPFDALQRATSALGIPTGKLGNVIFLPGILGSDLVDQNNRDLWILPTRLEELSLAADGISEANAGRVVTPTSPNFPHTAMLHVLELSWNVVAFAYDCRKDIIAAAQRLEQVARSNFGDAPFHIVAHSMGGLVARVLRAKSPGIQRGGKLVMLATPNHGSYLAVQALTLDVAASAFLRLWGVTAPPTVAMAAARTWPGAYQLLPCPLKDPTIQPFYSAPPADLSREHVDAAARLHAFLDHSVGAEELFYIAGSRIPTIDVPTTLLSDGDGVVSHRLGFLNGAKTFTVLGGHIDMLSNPIVLASITPLLHNGSHGLLW